MVHIQTVTFSVSYMCNVYYPDSSTPDQGEYDSAAPFE